MAMLRSFGGTRFTTRPAIAISPAVKSSSPAIIRSMVDFPHPEGPTSTTNSPWAISRSIAWITAVLPYALATPRIETSATSEPRHGVAPNRVIQLCLRLVPMPDIRRQSALILRQPFAVAVQAGIERRRRRPSEHSTYRNEMLRRGKVLKITRRHLRRTSYDPAEHCGE